MKTYYRQPNPPSPVGSLRRQEMKLIASLSRQYIVYGYHPEHAVEISTDLVKRFSLKAAKYLK